MPTAVAPKTATDALITNGLTGEVNWDVTQDVLDGAGFGWLIKNAKRGRKGNVRFYSKEGAAAAGDLSLVPRLILEYGAPAAKAVAADQALEPAASALPSRYVLAQNYPNPFNPETTIRFELHAEGAMRLEVYNLSGQVVRTLVDEYRSAGRYSVVWDGTDAAGRGLASGVYLYRIVAGEFAQTRKLILMR